MWPVLGSLVAQGEGEPSWEGSALSHSLASSKQVAPDPGVQQDREVGWRCQGLQAVLEQGIAGGAGCQGPQGCPGAGVGVLPVSLAAPHLSFLQWDAALGLLMGLSHAGGLLLSPSHPLFLTLSGLNPRHGGCEVCHSQTFVTHRVPFPLVPSMAAPCQPHISSLAGIRPELACAGGMAVGPWWDSVQGHETAAVWPGLLVVSEHAGLRCECGRKSHPLEGGHRTCFHPATRHSAVTARQWRLQG